MKTLKTLLQEITAGIKAWANASFSSGTHVHGNIANNGKLATASKVVISDSNKNITTSNVSNTELGYLSGVTSAIQTQISSKAYDADVVHTTGNETIAGTKTFASEINGTSSKAVADEDGNAIKSTYGKLAGDQTWTGINAYSQNINIKASSNIPANGYGAGVAFRDYQSNRLGYIQPHVTSDNNKTILFGADTGYLEFNSNLVPYASSVITLGSSAGRWSAVYADTYYYGTTAWGLDKENVWSGNNRFVKNVGLSDISTYSDNTMAFTANANTIFFNTRGSSNYPSFGTFLFAGYASGSAPDRYGQLKLVRSTDIKGGTYDGYKPDTSFNLWRVAPHYSLMDFVDAVRVQNDGTNNYIAPITNNATDLGNSTNKWKSLNGINPGALSLPDLDTAIAIDTTGWSVTGALTNTYTPTVNGWLVIDIKDTATNSVFIYAKGVTGIKQYSASVYGNGSQGTGRLSLMMPALANIQYAFVIKADSLSDINYVRYYPCLGNV